ncbi:hypothetical protein BSIN_0928 [Burkholderia singularis]|uniref:Uncharacterized protein n=1 Tax=Burkholderia singularis TaxID=1503053 RepID=A0A238HAU4_9BURK|nr:hypothetical protein BSIN_0928 [Burkholderia singularis]
MCVFAASGDKPDAWPQDARRRRIVYAPRPAAPARGSSQA